MMPTKIYELRNLYLQQSRYSAEPEERKYAGPPILRWPADSYFDRLKPDADLLQRALAPRDTYKTADISQRVFGNELKQQQISLKHTANLFYERCRLHQSHMEEIDDRHVKAQERLFGVEINRFPDRNKQLRTLEGQLLQLEQQRREEELAFWKDTVELRQILLDRAADYRGTQDRYTLFAEAEGEYDRR